MFTYTVSKDSWYFYFSSESGTVIWIFGDMSLGLIKLKLKFLLIMIIFRFRGKKREACQPENVFPSWCDCVLLQEGPVRVTNKHGLKWLFQTVSVSPRRLSPCFDSLCMEERTKIPANIWQLLTMREIFSYYFSFTKQKYVCKSQLT